MSVQRSIRLRSAVTNGTTVLIGVDMRSQWARRFRDLLEAHAGDLGGDENLSEAERSIIRRAATMEVELERLESSFATAEWDRPSGRPSTGHLDLYNRMSANLRRLLEALGLQRRARAIGGAGEPGALEELLTPAEYEEYVGPTGGTAATRRAATRDRAKREARRRTR